MSDTAHLAVLVHGVHAECNVTEQILRIQTSKDTVTRDDIFQEVKHLMWKYNFILTNLL
jgi:hypothetical protein